MNGFCAPISASSGTTCLLADFDVLAEGSSPSSRLRFNDRLGRVFRAGTGVCAGQGLLPIGREAMTRRGGCGQRE